MMDTNTGGVVTKHSDILTDDVTDDRDDMKHHCDSVSVSFQSVNNDTKLFVVDFLLETLLNNPSRKWAYYALWVPTKTKRRSSFSSFLDIHD